MPDSSPNVVQRDVGRALDLDPSEGAIHCDEALLFYGIESPSSGLDGFERR